MQRLFRYHDNLKNIECSDNILRDVAHHATQYSPNELGTRFDFKGFEIDNCDNQSGNKVEHRYQLFYCWKRKVGKHATYEHFLSNLCRCLPKDEGFIQEICKLILKERNLPFDCLSMNIEVQSDSSVRLSPSCLSADSATTVCAALDNASSLLSASVADNKYLLKHIKKQDKKLKRANQELENERKRRKISEEYLSEIKKENSELKEALYLQLKQVNPIFLEEDEQVPLCSPPPSTDDSQSSCFASSQTKFIQSQAFFMTTQFSPLPNPSPEEDYIVEDEETPATDENDVDVPSTIESLTLPSSIDNDQNEMVTGETLLSFDEIAQLEWPST